MTLRELASEYVERMPVYPWLNEVHRDTMLELFEEALTQGMVMGREVHKANDPLE